MSAEEVKLNNDVVVKQEYSATDSTEKNPTTAPPPAQTKPAQEQTRTENLQRIQQRKLKVIVFTFDLNFGSFSSFCPICRFINCLSHKKWLNCQCTQVCFISLDFGQNFHNKIVNAFSLSKMSLYGMEDTRGKSA